MSQFEKILTEAAIKAGDEIFKIKNLDLKAYEKADASPVTEADFLANRIIINALKENFDISIISEETQEEFIENHIGQTIESLDANEINYDRFFIIDPIDGTRDYIEKGKNYTVNIAYVENGIAKIGVIYAPEFGDLYYGDIDAYSYKLRVINGKITQKTRIYVNSSMSNPIRLVTGRRHETKANKEYIKSLGEINNTQMCSSLKFCLIAEGKYDIYPRLGGIAQWDVAAGDAILTAAGGNVLDLNHKPLRYGGNDNGVLHLNPYFIACGDFVPPNWGSEWQD